jgi:Xaa-Pro dipeptidase
MTLFAAQEFQNRIIRLQSLLREKNINIAIFNQSEELLYYSGSSIPLYCVVPADGESFLLSRKGSGRINLESTLPLELFANTRDLMDIFKNHSLSRIKRAGFILDLSSYNSVMRMSSLLERTEPVDISADVRALRMIKSAAEIVVQREASDIISKIPEVIRKAYRKGITELELSAHIEFYLRTHKGGAIRSKQEGLVLAGGVFTAGERALTPNKFDGICAGPGVSPALPFGGSDDVLPKNTAIVCDYGFVLQGYHVDMTRMFSIGEPPAKAVTAHNAMLTVQKHILEAMKPGVTFESVWAVAETSAAALGYAEQFMGLGSEKVRFVGHGLGLFLDEPPYIAPKMKSVLEENMVLAIEPKVSLPGIGVVGIENTVLVGADGTEVLTRCPEDFYIL